MSFDRQMWVVVWSVAGFLLVASLAGFVLAKTVCSEKGVATVANLNARIRAWWVMVMVFISSIWLGPIGSYVLFGLISFWALREFVTLTPTRRAGLWRLFLGFFIFVPLPYLVVA